MTTTNYFDKDDITVYFVMSYNHNGRTYYKVSYYITGIGANFKSVSKKTAIEVAKKFHVNIYN